MKTQTLYVSRLISTRPLRCSLLSRWLTVLPRVVEDGTVWPGCGEKFSRRDACYRHLKKRLNEGICSEKVPSEKQFHSKEAYQKRRALYEDMILNKIWRAKLPLAEKNRLARTVFPDMKHDML